MAKQSKLAVILHADVVGSTALVQVDEQLAHERIRATFASLSDSISSAGGSVREVRGDALVATFERASDAVGMAIAFQTDRQANAARTSDEMAVHLRVRIALGEVIVADETVTGAGVVLAQRIEQLAPADGVCVSAAVREAMPERLGLAFEDIGEQSLKGFDRPQRIYRDKSLGASGERGRRAAPAHSTAPAPARDGERPSIAVLPFEHRAGGDDSQFLATGLVEDVTSSLSALRWLIVISYASAHEVASHTSDPRKAGEELGVRFLLTGSIRQAGARIRVMATLSETATSRQLWSNRYERVVDDIFAVQDEMARSIAAELVPELTATDLESITSKAPENLSAWEAYQRGLAELRHQSVESYANASDFFHSAIERDPRFASAYSALGHVLFRQIQWDLVPREASIARMFTLAETALDLDPKDSGGYVVRGLAHLMRREYEAALREVDAGLVLNPSSAFAYVMRGAVNTFSMLSHEQALEDFDHAERLSPTDRFDGAQRLAGRAFANLCLGRYEQSARHGAEAWRAGGLHGGLFGAAAQVALGEVEAARELVAEILARHPTFDLDLCRSSYSYMPASGELDRLFEQLATAGVPAGPT